jgi:HTH-type transcriptional regulator / antitoxin HigA
MSKLIRNERQYKDALNRMDKLKSKKVKKGSDKAEELDMLSLLVDHYEVTQGPLSKLKPIAAIKYKAKQQGISETQLTKVFGYRSRKSEIFSGARKLSLEMIRRIHTKLNIPAEVLIKKY